ncbi:MAG TPA: hypothetical protein VF268_02470 [Gammaproteobacteria bacterium]
MRKIRVEPGITAEMLSDLANQWQQCDNVTLVMPDQLSGEEINYLFSLVLEILPMDFGFCVLQELAEREKVSEEILSIILSCGDRVCIESVCLREDLSSELKRVCESMSLHLLDQQKQ